MAYVIYQQSLSCAQVPTARQLGCFEADSSDQERQLPKALERLGHMPAHPMLRVLKHSAVEKGYCRGRNNYQYGADIFLVAVISHASNMPHNVIMYWTHI